MKGALSGDLESFFTVMNLARVEQFIQEVRQSTSR